MRDDPWRLARFRRDVAAVLVQTTSGARGEWLLDGRTVRLQTDFVKAADTSALAIASTLVHEGAQLIAETERQLARDPAYWTDAAFLGRDMAYLGELGFPGWLIRLMLRIRRRMAG